VDGVLIVGDNNAVTASVTRHIDVPVALDEMGRRVPDDITVTGYDNWSVFALETEPQLTTIDMNLEALGAAAAKDPFMIIDGAPRQGGVRRHACELVIRGSSVR
jgi:LacI family transcriptional regulator, galactose operon repressor